MLCENPVNSRTVKPITDLLVAHAELIDETSETMAADLAKSLQRLRQELPESEREEAIQDTMSELISALQYQDLVRQQIGVLIQGLESVACASVPSEDSPEEWFGHRLKEIEDGYVMQAQVLVHEKILGISKDTASSDDDIFFD